jgi:DNA-binding transcriptional LysR family regulator
VPRNLDLAALRALLTVAETGGVTRAAARLNLTQSAVSMQIKRLEEAVGQPLLDRTGRGVATTAQGDLLLSYARRMLALNDEAMGRMTGDAWEGELVLGAPHDVVYPHIPGVLARFARSHPRVRVTLVSSITRKLKDRLARGEADLILTTEDRLDPGGETLALSPMVWIGAPGGEAWRRRPLPLAFEPGCLFRGIAVAALNRAGIDWTMAVEADSTRTVEASVSADLGLCAILESAMQPYFEAVPHGGALPALPTMRIGLYRAGGPKAALIDRLADAVREAYGAPGAVAAA